MATTSMEILGKSGLNITSGYVLEPYLNRLTGQQGREIFRQMETSDPIIGAVLFAIEYYLRQMNRIVEPGNRDDAQSVELAEFCESLLDDMSHSWEDTLSEIVTFLPYGWAYLEIIYKLRKGENDNPTMRSVHTDGKIGWRKLALRAQTSLEKWEFDDDGGIRGMHQRASPGYELVLIPIEKALLFRTTARYSNPEGRSVLTNAYRPWYFKRNLEQIEAVGMERDLAGLPVAYIPVELMYSDATPEDKKIYAMWKDIVTKTKRNELEGVVVPLDYDANSNPRYKFELLSTGGERQLDIGSAIARYKQEMAMTTLADWILLGHEKIGTQALSITKSEIFQKALQGWADGICDVFNAHAFRRIAKLNGYTNVELPVLRMIDPPKVDLRELGEFVEKVAGAGATLFPDFELEKYLREVGNMPVPEKAAYEELIREKAAQAELQPSSNGATEPKEEVPT